MDPQRSVIRFDGDVSLYPDEPLYFRAYDPFVPSRPDDDVGDDVAKDGVTVLVVEDNPGMAYLWERYLNLMGCRPVSTRWGVEALSLAQQEQPAVVILDIMLPGVDGWTVLRSLRGDEETCEIPVIMCSALDARDRGLAEGAAAYLRKPVTLEMFRSALTMVGVG